MKITRYVNGKRTTKPFDDSTVIEKAEISSVISRVNHRLSGLQTETNSNISGAEDE